MNVRHTIISYLNDFYAFLLGGGPTSVGVSNIGLVRCEMLTLK